LQVKYSVSLVSVKRKCGNGRKRALNGLIDRVIYRLAKADPEISCRIIKETLSLRVSELIELCSFFRKKKPLRRKANMRKRLMLAKSMSTCLYKTFWD